MHQHIPVLWTLASGDTAKDIEERTAFWPKSSPRFQVENWFPRFVWTSPHVPPLKKPLVTVASVRVDVNQAWMKQQPLRNG